MQCIYLLLLIRAQYATMSSRYQRKDPSGADPVQSADIAVCILSDNVIFSINNEN